MPNTWEQIINERRESVDRAAAMETDEQLPAYSEAMQGRQSVDVAEKKQQPEVSKPGKLSKLKSALTMGDVQRHNPYYVLDRSVSEQQPRSSTLRSIISGKHHASNVMEVAANSRAEALSRASSSQPRPKSDTKSPVSTARSIMTGQHHASRVMDVAANARAEELARARR